MHYFDAHNHLQDARLRRDMEAIMERAEQNQVLRMACCGSTEDDWKQVEQLYERYPSRITPLFGLHPWYLETRTTSWLKTLRTLLLRHKSAGVGEFGLDRLKAKASDEEQINIFCAHMELAVELDLPCSIHILDAWGLLDQALAKCPTLPHRWMIHSFSGSSDTALKLVRIGAHISFSGAITRPNGKRVREAAKVVPEKRLLIETDAPDQEPRLVLQGRNIHDVPNEPAHLKWIAAELATIRGEPVEELAGQLYRTTVNFYAPAQGQDMALRVFDTD